MAAAGKRCRARSAYRCKNCGSSFVESWAKLVSKNSRSSTPGKLTPSEMAGKFGELYPQFGWRHLCCRHCEAGWTALSASSTNSNTALKNLPDRKVRAGSSTGCPHHLFGRVGMVATAGETKVLGKIRQIDAGCYLDPQRCCGLSVYCMRRRYCRSMILKQSHELA